MSEPDRSESSSMPVPRGRGRVHVWLSIWLLVPVLVGCATITSDFRQPGVTVISVKPRLLNGMSPEFDILLRVTNPNRKALKIAGLSYEVRLAGSKVIEGVASELPRIEAYGEAEVMLRARADLLGSLGLLSRLMNEPDAPVAYEFNAEIDLGAFYPAVRVNRSGNVSL